MTEIRAWWKADPTERYWIEFDRDREVGGQLQAPRADDPTKSKWPWKMLEETQVGDIVIHWRSSHAADQSQIVGWSVIADEPTVGHFAWDAVRDDSDYGRSLGTIVPLTSFHPLDRPVWARDLRDSADDIMTVRDDLQARYGSPLYFPLTIRNQRLSGIQGYFTKFPRELLPIIAKHGDLELPETLA